MQQIDNWGPAGHGPKDTRNEPPDAMDYTDAVALMRDHRAKYQSAMYQIGAAVTPQREGQHPITAIGEAVYSEFFPMFDVPFKYGSGWSAAARRFSSSMISIASIARSRTRACHTWSREPSR